jgi:hypothetical protein
MINGVGMRAEGHVLIRDGITKEIIRDEYNAIHYGNLAASVAEALSGLDTGHIRYMAFGNGGTAISANGEITYRTPDVTNVRDPSSSLYSEIYHQEVGKNGSTNDGNDPANTVIPIQSNSQYSDVKITCTLDFEDTGSTQDPIDRANNLEDATIFDEIALYTGDPNIPISTTLANSNDALMISHVIFHPIQKSNNRILEIDYTIRIYLEAV